MKVCGLTRREDAEAAAGAGARYGGVILAPGRARTVHPAAAAEIFRGSPLIRVGVFVDAGAAEIRDAVAIAGLDVVQLHGAETPELAGALRAEGLRVWKAIRPRGAAELLEGLERFRGAVDGILLDGWSPVDAGGTGTPFPWTEIAPHRERIEPGTDLVVAGGLRPDNVRDAVARLRPEVVDVSSGVESAPGIKDHGLIRAFVRAAAATDGSES